MTPEQERRLIVEFMRDAIGSGYFANKTGAGAAQCVHGKFDWDDCISCYDEHLEGALQAIERGEHLQGLENTATQGTK